MAEANVCVVWSDGKPITVVKGPDLNSTDKTKVSPSGFGVSISKALRRLEKGVSPKNKEQEDQVELRRLRQETQIMRKRIENLEKDAETLTNRLVYQQMSSARREEETFALKRELSQLKEQQSQEKLIKLNSVYKEQKEHVKIDQNKMKQKNDENDRLKEELEKSEIREQELQSRIREMERKVSFYESKSKEDMIVSRIKDTEHGQIVAELRQRIAELEIANQELITASQIQVKGDNNAMMLRISDLESDNGATSDDLDAIFTSPGKSKLARQASLRESLARFKLDINSSTEEEGTCGSESEHSVKKKPWRRKRKARSISDNNVNNTEFNNVHDDNVKEIGTSSDIADESRKRTHDTNNSSKNTDTNNKTEVQEVQNNIKEYSSNSTGDEINAKTNRQILDTNHF